LKTFNKTILLLTNNSIKLYKELRINSKRISSNSTWKENYKWWSLLASDLISVSFECSKTINMNEGYKNYYYLLILTSTLYSMSYQCVSKVNLYEFIRNRGVIVSRTSFMRSFVAHSWQSNIFLSSCKHECSTCPKIIIQIPSHLFWTRGENKATRRPFLKGILGTFEYSLFFSQFTIVWKPESIPAGLIFILRNNIKAYKDQT